MLTDKQWAMLEPLIEICRPPGQDRAPGPAPHALGHPLAAYSSGVGGGLIVASMQTELKSRSGVF